MNTLFETWTPSETLYGRQCAHADWPALERRLLGDMAKEAYIAELARLLDVKIEEAKPCT